MSIYSVDQMSDAELVAAIFSKKVVDDECIHVAQVLAREDTVTNILAGHSIQATKLARIEASLELGRRSLMARQVRRAYDTRVLDAPEKVVELMSPYYADEEREVFYCLCLNTKNHLKKLHLISIGSLNASIVHPRELFKVAVSVSAATIVITHNHPSGDPTPSGADVALTRRLVKAGDVLGIELMDHIVIGGGGRYASFRDKGLL